MTIPTSGAFTSDTIKNEWGFGLPFNSDNVRNTAGLGQRFTSDDLRGRSAFSISIGTQNSNLAGPSTNRYTQWWRTLTASTTGGAYSWSISEAQTGRAYFTNQNANTIRINVNAPARLEAGQVDEGWDTIKVRVTSNGLIAETDWFSVGR